MNTIEDTEVKLVFHQCVLCDAAGVEDHHRAG